MEFESLFSSARMKLLVHAFQLARLYVGINLSGLNARVPQHLLNESKVCTAGQQVRGKTVPQRMWAHLVRDTDAFGIPLDQLPNRFAPQPLSRTG